MLNKFLNKARKDDEGLKTQHKIISIFPPLKKI